MIPPTKNGLPAMVCLSAMQKSIRRNMELEAMQFAVELMHTSKGFTTMVLNRLNIIAQEDVDCAAAPHVVPFVRASTETAKQLYDKRPENPGGARMCVANIIRILCRAPKSRWADHFQAAVGLRELLEGFKPDIPDWAIDRHTPAGKRMGRGLKHFREVGTMLLDPVDATVVPEDEFADEAYRPWELRDAQKK